MGEVGEEEENGAGGGQNEQEGERVQEGKEKRRVTLCRNKHCLAKEHMLLLLKPIQNSLIARDRYRRSGKHKLPIGMKL